MDNKKALKGGEFLIRETEAKDVFIPEEFNEEQRMMAQTCKEFTETQVIPNMDQLEKHDRELLSKMMKDAGELGLLGISIPEEYEGFGQNFITTMYELVHYQYFIMVLKSKSKSIFLNLLRASIWEHIVSLKLMPDPTLIQVKQKQFSLMMANII